MGFFPPVRPQVVEFASPPASFIRIDAMVKLPPLDPAQRYRLRQAAIHAADNVPGFTPKVILDTLVPGYRLGNSLLPEYLRLSLTIPPENLNAGLGIVTSILAEPSFEARRVNPATELIQIQGWNRVYESESMQPFRYRPADLAEIWRHVIVPSRVVIGVSGRFIAGAPTRIANELGSPWDRVLTVKYPPRILAPKPALLPKSNFLVMKSKLPAVLPVHVVAATILGAGKESPLWKASREELAISYRQEAFLLPVAGGWEFRVAIGSDPLGIAQGDKLVTRLKALVARLGPQDLRRAQTVLRSALIDQLGEFPVHYPESDAFSSALWWQLKQGQRWNPEDMNGLIREVSLEQAKKYLLEMLAESKFEEI